jgi:hypothetical protein
LPHDLPKSSLEDAVRSDRRSDLQSVTAALEKAEITGIDW